MHKKKIFEARSLLRFGSLPCAFLAAGLIVQSPQPAAAGWLGDLLFGGSSRQNKKIKKKRVQPTKRAPLKQSVAAPPLEIPAGIGEHEPVQIVVSLPEQKMRVYKGGVQIATSRISSGKLGHTTPSGVFSILQKRREHYSNIYDNAPMPYMQRLTWSGVALHAGRVPNYPASHGCVRMPHAFARQLFGVTNMGGQVLITAAEAPLTEIRHEKLFQPAVLATIFDPKYLAAASIGVNRAAETESEPNEADAASAFDGVNRRPVSTAHAPTSQRVAAIDPTVENLHIYEGRDDTPLRILITRRTEREQILDVQEMLNQLDYDVGPPDGQIGRATRDAIVDFQKKHKLKVTGRSSDELWRLLNKETGTWRYATGHLYVRQGHKDIFDAAVTINRPSEPIGTHVYTAMHFATESTATRWTAVTLKQSRPPRNTDHISDEEDLKQANAVDAVEALERVEIPDRLRRRIEAMLTPGSSIIISDNGIDQRETGKGTDFIVRTW